MKLEEVLREHKCPPKLDHPQRLLDHYLHLDQDMAHYGANLCQGQIRMRIATKILTLAIVPFTTPDLQKKFIAI